MHDITIVNTTNYCSDDIIGLWRSAEAEVTKSEMSSQKLSYYNKITLDRIMIRYYNGESKFSVKHSWRDPHAITVGIAPKAKLLGSELQTIAELTREEPHVPREVSMGIYQKFLAMAGFGHHSYSRNVNALPLDIRITAMPTREDRTKARTMMLEERVKRNDRVVTYLKTRIEGFEQLMAKTLGELARAETQLEKDHAELKRMSGS